MKSGFDAFGLRCALALAVILWSAPFLVNPHTFPISTFYAEALAIAAAILLGAVALLLRIRQGGPLPVAMIALAPVGFVVVLFAQLATMHLARPMPAFLAIFFCLCATLSIQAGLWLGQDRSRAEGVLRACAVGSVLGGLISSALAWMQAFGLETHYSPWVAVYPYADGRRLFANLYQANHLGTVCTLAMASVLYLRRTAGISRVTLGATLIVLGVGAAFTASRTPMLQVAVVAIGATALVRLRAGTPTAWRQAVTFGASPAVALIAAMLLVAWLDQVFDLRLAISAVERLAGDGKGSTRLALWHYAIEVFRQHPLLGAGWGEYVRAQYLIADRLGAVEMANNAHNMVLDLLAKTGVLGASVVLLPCLYWGWRNIKEIRVGNHAVQRVFCLTLVSVVAVHAMLEFPQNYAFFLLPVCLLMGLAETGSLQGMTRGLSIGLSFAMVASLSAGLVAAYYDYRKAEVAYEDKGALRYGMNPAFIFGDWARYGLISTMSLDKELLPEKISMHENALTISASPNFIRRYIILLALDNRTDEALLQVARLKSFSMDQFEQQYAWLVGMCDEQKGAVSGFKERLLKLYGMPRVLEVKRDNRGELTR